MPWSTVASFVQAVAAHAPRATETTRDRADFHDIEREVRVLRASEGRLIERIPGESQETLPAAHLRRRIDRAHPW
jgi:hypothetical protein